MRHNLLIDRMPETVRVGEDSIFIRTDFRVGLLFELMMWDTGLTARQKVWQALRLYYRDEDLGKDAEAAYRAAVWFFAGGGGKRAGRGKAREGEARRVVDFDADADVIYAAFLDQYGVDLQDVEGLHWWKFRAMFLGLRGDHEICRRMGLRGLRLASIKGKEERARLARLKESVRIDGGVTTEEMARRAGAVFGG